MGGVSRGKGGCHACDISSNGVALWMRRKYHETCISVALLSWLPSKSSVTVRIPSNTTQNMITASVCGIQTISYLGL